MHHFWGRTYTKWAHLYVKFKNNDMNGNNYLNLDYKTGENVCEGPGQRRDKDRLEVT